MTEKEADAAFDAYCKFDAKVVKLGVKLLKGLNPEQVAYVIDRMHDEFRFWRVTEGLKKQ